MTEISLMVSVYTTDSGSHHVQLVKVDSSGNFLDYFLINDSLPDRAVQEAFANDLAQWLNVKTMSMVKIGGELVYQVRR